MIVPWRKRRELSAAAPKSAETTLASAYGRMVLSWQNEALRLLGLDSDDKRTDAHGAWSVRALFGSAWRDETFGSQSDAEEHARRLRAQGIPAEVFAPGPLPAWHQPKAAASVLRSLEVRIGHGLSEEAIARMVDPIAGRVSRENLRRVGKALSLDSARSDPAVNGKLAAFRRQNAELIRTLPKKAIAEIQPLIAQAHAEGWRVERLREVIVERWDVERSHAYLIARDQVLKLNGQITQARHEAAGVTHYVWTSSKDERVRPEHRRLDGKTFAWSDPPEVAPGRREHPGGDFQCRCTPFPVLPSYV